MNLTTYTTPVSDLYHLVQWEALLRKVENHRRRAIYQMYRDANHEKYDAVMAVIQMKINTPLDCICFQ